MPTNPAQVMHYDTEDEKLTAVESYVLVTELEVHSDD